MSSSRRRHLLHRIFVLLLLGSNPLEDTSICNAFQLNTLPNSRLHPPRILQQHQMDRFVTFNDQQQRVQDLSNRQYVVNRTLKRRRILQKKNDVAISPPVVFANPPNSGMEAPVGAFLALGVILVLGFSSVQGGGVDEMAATSATTTASANGVAIATVTNLIDASVPSSSTDLLAIALGESIGGVIGAVFSVGINLLLRAAGKARRDENVDDDGDENGSTSLTTVTTADGREMPSSFFSQALSDSDFFIANSAALSLLEVLGVSTRTAQLWSVLIAAVPSQLVKLGPILQEQRLQEEQILEELLRREQDEKDRLRRRPFSLLRGGRSYSRSASSTVPMTDLKELRSVNDDGGVKVDFVAVFADITRWLEYDVLKSEYGEILEMNMIDSGGMGALLGLLAAVSSRLYADVLYGQFGYGPRAKQREVRSRSVSEWLSLYFSTAASAATLFGVYELSQRPISRYIQGTLAGGVEGCIGSNDFEYCLQTYINTNAPGPSPDAQFRALIVNLSMLAVRLQDIAGDTTYDDIAALVRAWSVSLMSYLNSFAR